MLDGADGVSGAQVTFGSMPDVFFFVVVAESNLYWLLIFLMIFLLFFFPLFLLHVSCFFVLMIALFFALLLSTLRSFAYYKNTTKFHKMVNFFC